MEALNRGNGAQASQIWLNMDADSRAAFAHSEGMKPNVSESDVKKQVMKHYMGEMGPTDSEESIDQTTPNVGSGGLQSLPEYIDQSGTAPQAVTVPSASTRSN
jgi:hypothetical protein